MCPNLSNPDSDGSRQNPKKAIFYGLNLKRFIFLWVGLAFVIILPAGNARASIFSFVADLWASETKAAENESQNVDLLQAVLSNDSLPSSVTVDTQIVDDNSLLSDSGPLGSAADVASSSSATSDQISVYKVRPGDTLSGIADMYNVTINTILWSNDLKRTSALREGQTLVILPISGLRYTVQKGDTLASIVKKHGGDKDEIISFNNLESEKLTVGTVIIIPDGEALAPAPTKKVVVTENGKKKVVYQDPRPDYSGYFAWPVSGGRKSQGTHGHNGIDIAAPAGTPILASAAGTVILAREGGYNGGYGSYVVIKHSNGTQTLYAHANFLSVSEGQTVTKGQKIGGIGSTGRSTGNHLHFEVRGAKNPY